MICCNREFPKCRLFRLSSAPGAAAAIFAALGPLALAGSHFNSLALPTDAAHIGGLTPSFSAVTRFALKLPSGAF